MTPQTAQKEAQIRYVQLNVSLLQQLPPNFKSER